MARMRCASQNARRSVVLSQHTPSPLAHLLRVGARTMVRCSDHEWRLGSVESARAAVSGRASRAVAVVQRLRGAARPLARVGPRRRRPGAPPRRGARPAHRGPAIGLLVAALTVGSAAPHPIRGLTDLPWRHTLLAASVLAAAGALTVTLVTEGPHRFPPARFDLRMATAVLRERGPRLACFG